MARTENHATEDSSAQRVATESSAAEKGITPGCGPIVLLGSGETAPGAQRIYHDLFVRMAAPIRFAVLETPAGFEPNSAQVAGAVAAFIEKRLQNFRPAVTVVPARKRGTAFSPDDAEILTPLYGANVLFMGPGSPTYAVRQLQHSRAWQLMQARHRLGAALIFASAATLALSRWTLPIYEIYKVGEDLHWKSGLDLFGAFGLPLTVVPHWNNTDGGAGLDTSRCYIGAERFAALRALLPAEAAAMPILGLDEQTALVIEPEQGICRVKGVGGVTLLAGEQERRWSTGAEFALTELGAFHLPPAGGGLSPAIWADALQGHAAVTAEALSRPTPDVTVLALVQARAVARAAREWSTADSIRRQLEALGWQVNDTPAGATLDWLGRQ